jgi:phytanoyl-CoA hydroxylase
MGPNRPKFALDDAQVAHLHEQGYLIVEGVFDDADLQPAIDDINQYIDRRAAELIAEGELTEDFADDDFEHRLAKISKQTNKIAHEMWNGSLHGPGFFSIITNPNLLDVAEALCGEELIASSVYRMRPKIPVSQNSAVPWHQDSGYFEPYCDDALVLTVWLPLVDATKDNGCLWVIPGSHRLPVLPHRNREGKPYLEIAEEDLPQGERVCCPVPKGGVLLLTNRTVHVSFDNNTDGVRYSMDLRYQSAALPTNAPITRLEDESQPEGELGEEDYVPIACYPPEADFLVRSKARPNEVLTDAKAFAELRSKHPGGKMTQRWRKDGNGAPGAGSY